ncbi:MAG: hypothetical protein SOW66_08450 [Porphyromonas sp.]|nr:hypothetical protein [Porphyromonas sp.]
MAPIDLKKYLEELYPTHHGSTRVISFSDYSTETQEKYFELEDKCTPVIQPQGEGISALKNSQGQAVWIVDFERYIDGYNPSTKAYKGAKCDFVIVPQQGYDYIILNELTRTNPRYIAPFTQAKKGQQQPGKRAVAVGQLEETIRRLHEAEHRFLSQYMRRVALFSYRYPEGTSADVATASMSLFAQPTAAFSNISAHGELSCGFVFEQRLYPAVYELS